MVSLPSSKSARVGLATTLVATGLALAGPAGTAQAATARNGVCESGEFCLYWGSSKTGSVSDFNSSISNYGSTQPTCYDFKGAGAGKGTCVKNNAASVWNRTSRSVTVFFNSGYAGASQTFGSGVSGNLNSTLVGNNASHRIN